MRLIHYTESFEKEARRLAEEIGAEAACLTSVSELLAGLARLKSPLEQWHVFADASVYGFYCLEGSASEVLGRTQWEEIRPTLEEGAEVVLHFSYADRWFAPMLSNAWGVQVLAKSNGCVFKPRPVVEDVSYDSSAVLYDAAFSDMRVREEEWNFVTRELADIRESLGRRPSVVEIGCGNGQLLRQLSEGGWVDSSRGLDASAGMVERARSRQKDRPELSFELIEGSSIPCEPSSVDVVISFMSFRYLDWPAIAKEIQRVLRPGGAFLMVDMAETTLSDEDREEYEETKKRTRELHASQPEFAENLRRLVEHPEWIAMLKYHPKELASAYKGFLQEAFTGGNWRRLYVCFDHSLFGFSWRKAQ